MKWRTTLGIFMVFISIVLLVAFTSYLITGTTDQNILRTGINDLNKGEIKNWLGKLGAIISQKCIGDWFGISAFIFIPILLRKGFIILFKTSSILGWTVFKYSLFILLWLPACMSFLFTNGSTLFLGGGIGYTIIQYLEMGIGSVGTFLVLLFLLFTFIIINFEIRIEKIWQYFNPSENPNEVDAIHMENKPNPLGQETQESIPIAEAGLHTPDQPTPSNDLSQESEIPLKLNIISPDPTSLPQHVLSTHQPLSVLDTPKTPHEKNQNPRITPISQTDQGAQQTTPSHISSTTHLPTTAINVQDELKQTDEEPLEIEAIIGEEEVLKDSEIRDLAKEFGNYDPELDLSRYQKPSLDLLKDFGKPTIEVDRTELENNKNRIITTLKNYKIEISEISAVIGPTVTLYEIVPAPGVRISKIKNLEDDIALSLSALGIRIIAPIPGKGTIGIEVPNRKSDIVSMKTMLASDRFQNTDMILPIALGKTISNESYIADLAKMPHLLMAGATGQGKSVGLNAILVSLLYKMHPSQLKFVLVDPKKVELTLYNKIERHYLAKIPDTDEAIITDTQKVVATLNSLCIEMDTRYDLLKAAMARTITEYNDKFIQRKLNPENGHRYLPYIVLVIDEFADLIMTAGKEVETPIARLAQLARAIGIHLIVATQRPSVNVITGMIKANFPARLAFRVTSKIDSRTILDVGGADQLIGRGDLLFSPGNEVIRLQCAFVDTPEVEKICDFIGGQQGYSDAYLLPEFVGEASASQDNMDSEDRDALFDQAATIVVQHQQGSASLLQRR